VLDARENRMALPSERPRRDADAAESVQMRMETSNRTGRRARAGGSRGRRTKRAPPSGFRPRRPPSRDPAVENRGAPASARRAVPSEQLRQQWGQRVCASWYRLTRSPGILLSNAELFLSEALAVTTLGTGSR
jgi:hypothetical protein